MVAAITGLAAILHVSAIAFQVIKWLGVAYLLYLAGQPLRDQSAIQVEDNHASVSFWRVVRTAVLINLLNPKLTASSSRSCLSSCPPASPTAAGRWWT
jgi:threonine/homoserine/homoserine lactone efflux protein